MTPSLRRLAALLLGGALLVTAACSTPEPSTTETSADGPTTEAVAGGAQERVVATEQGDVTIPGDPQTIVVLNSNLAGYLFSLDIPVAATLPEEVGGETVPDTIADDAADQGTVVLPWSEDGFDFEAILALAPDLIVAGGQGFSAFQAVEAYDRLGEIAPTVLVSSALLSWEEQLDFIGNDVFGATEATQGLFDAYDARVEEVKAAITVPEGEFAYLLTTLDETPYSIPETAALPQTLAAVGFEPSPVIADNPGFETYGTGDSFELSTEQLATVFTAPSILVLQFFEGEGPDAEALAQDPLYAALPAFQNGQVHELPSYAYRADYTRTMALLDHIEGKFS